jgi:hypothetical protein
MGLFGTVFNRAGIYDMFFFNIKTVLEYKDLPSLERENPMLYERWEHLCNWKYVVDYEKVYTGEMRAEEAKQLTYEKHAVKHPEYCKIVAITYATLKNEDDKIVRVLKKIVNNDETIVIKQFFDVLRFLSSNGVSANPQFFPTLCGHDIIGRDIPFLLKRHIMLSKKNGSSITDKQIPFMLKRSLDSKPWESGVIIDTANVWKLNGYDRFSLMMISDFLGLKKTVEVVSHKELSKYYWDNVGSSEKDTLDYIGLQSATQTNLIIQLMNELKEY